jgi:hypothetical protein
MPPMDGSSQSVQLVAWQTTSEGLQWRERCTKPVTLNTIGKKRGAVDDLPVGVQKGWQPRPADAAWRVCIHNTRQTR